MIEFNPRELSFENVDRFYIKKSIYNFICSNSKLFKDEFLDVGCGEMPYKDLVLENQSVTTYSGVDLIDGIEYKDGVRPDYFWDGIQFPFQNGSFDSAMATEVLEHCPDPLVTLKEVYRVLKEGSPFLITVPFIWPTHEGPFDYYRYTPFALRYLLEKVGFQDIQISCLGGWDASLAQVLGLWIKRRKMSRKNQKRLFYLVKPIIKFLLRKDRVLDESSDQNLMTSIGVVAWKK